MSIKIDQEMLRGVVEKVMADLGRPVSSAGVPAAGAGSGPQTASSPGGDCGCHSGPKAGAGHFGVFEDYAEVLPQPALLFPENLGAKLESSLL